MTDSTPAPRRESDYSDAVVRQTAEKILASYRTLFVDSYPLGPIDRSAYEPATFEWYDETTRALTPLGYTAYDDLKIVKDAARPEPGAGPFARRFLSGDGMTRIDAFQMWNPVAKAWVRVVNAVTETNDGRFLWTTTAEPRWITPDHVVSDNRPPGTSPVAVVTAHAERLAGFRSQHPGVAAVTMTSLAEMLESENRCQARTAAFRRQQGVPSVEELVRLGSEPTLAKLTHRAMHESVFGPPAAPPALEGEWHVATVELSPGIRGPMSFAALIDFALDQGLSQVEKVGSPLNPFLVDETGKAYFFVCTSGNGDPLEIALRTLHCESPNATACALVIDSKIGMRDGKKTDAIVVMASRRDAPEGELWAHGYRPKGLFRAFKRLEVREQIGTTKSFFEEATASAGA